MANQVDIIIKAVDKASGEINKVTGAGNKLAAGFKSLTGFSLAAGGAIGIASAALKKMYDYSKVAIAAASDLAESESKVGVVFGDQADAMLAWGQTAAEAMGMSSNEALAAAGTYGNLFRAMGITEKASADMSQALVELAADLASFNNMDPTEVLGKLRAGLSGETEPLKTLGVNLNQAIIQQKALELGLWDGVGALDAAQKAQASYALILEQTSLAQGDFERTSEGLANQQRILKAANDDLAAAIGEYLLPTQTKIVESQTQLVIGIKDTIDGWNDERSQLERLGLVYDQHIGYMKDGVLLTAEQVNEMKNADRANQAWTDSLNAQADAWFELHPELRQGAEELNEIADAVDGRSMLSLTGSIQSAEERYTDTLERLTEERKNLLAEQATATGEALAEINGKLDENEDALQDNVNAHTLAKNTIMLGYLEQLLAADGLTSEEANMLLDQGVKWGVYSQTAVDEMRDVMEEMGLLADHMNGLPEHKTFTYTIMTNYGGEGGGIGGAERISGVDLNGNGIIGKARGGQVSTSTPYLVGEVGPELFVPNTSGNIVPNNQLGGSKVINFYYSPALWLSDRAEAEMRIKPMLRQLIRDV